VSWVIVALVFVALAVLAALASQRGGRAKPGYPYVRARALFTPAERSFLTVIDRAVGNDHRVFGKVRIADVASVKSGLNASTRQSALNRVVAKHFDFIVCRASDLSIVCAVELDDKSHASERAQARDAVKTKVSEAIGLPLVRIAAKRGYSVQEVRAQLASAMNQATAGSSVKP
jgi:very-short-patch-repair endonuclease